MDHDTIHRDESNSDDPDTIRAAMSETRAALTQKLEALSERLLGSVDSAPNQGVLSMAVKKKAPASAKKSAVSTKAKPAKKVMPQAKSKAKAAPAKKAASSKSAPSKAKPKTAVAKIVAKVKPKAKKASPKKKTTAGRIVQKAKEVLGDMLMGAASGAMKGAAEAIVTPAQEATQAVQSTSEQIAADPPKQESAPTQQPTP